MSITPNTSVRPAASRNSINPNCRPLRACSTTSTAGSALHRAALHVGVAVVLQDRLVERLVDQAALAVAADRANVVVLDRILVAVELERPADRLEARRLERLQHRGLVLEPALGVAHCRGDQLRGV